MAKIVDVTDVPELPGAGLLHFDDGRKPLLALPEIADEHRERLGMSAMRDGVAGPGASPDYAKQDREDLVNTAKKVGNWFTTPFHTREGEAPPASAAPQQPLPSNVSVATPQQWAAMQPPPSAPPAPGQVPPSIAVPPTPEPSGEPVDPALAASDARMDQMLTTGRRPGGGGVARPAGFSPEGHKVTTEQGPAYDTAAARDRLDAGSMVLQAQMAKAESEKQQAEAMASHAVAQHLAAQQQVANQQAEMLRKQQVYQEQDQHLQSELADYSESAKPDPNKFWSTPGGAFSGVLSIIGQGLGAFGATLGRTENWAFQAAQQKMRMEMAAQEKAYDAGRGDRKNALARLAEYYHGDMDKARLALSQSLNKVAETETLAFGAQSKSKDIAANAKVLAAQFQQQQLLDEQRRMELAAGKTTSESTEKYHQATSGEGPRLSLADEVLLRKDRRKEAPTADKQADIQLKYGEQRRNLDAARQAYQEQADVLGVKVNWQTGEVLGRDGKPVDPSKVSIPGLGTVTDKLPNWSVGVEGRRARNVMKKAIDAYRKESTGVAYSPEELKAATDQYIGFSNEDTIRNFQQHVAEIAAKDRSLEAGFPKDVVRTRDKRAAETNLDHAAAGARAPKVTPYE